MGDLEVEFSAAFRASHSLLGVFMFVEEERDCLHIHVWPIPFLNLHWIITARKPAEVEHG